MARAVATAAAMHTSISSGTATARLGAATANRAALPYSAACTTQSGSHHASPKRPRGRTQSPRAIASGAPGGLACVTSDEDDEAGGEGEGDGEGGSEDDDESNEGNEEGPRGGEDDEEGSEEGTEEGTDKGPSGSEDDDESNEGNEQGPSGGEDDEEGSEEGTDKGGSENDDDGSNEGGSEDDDEGSNEGNEEGGSEDDETSSEEGTDKGGSEDDDDGSNERGSEDDDEGSNEGPAVSSPAAWAPVAPAAPSPAAWAPVAAPSPTTYFLGEVARPAESSSGVPGFPMWYTLGRRRLTAGSSRARLLVDPMTTTASEACSESMLLRNSVLRPYEALPSAADRSRINPSISSKKSTHGWALSASKKAARSNLLDPGPSWRGSPP